MIKKIIFLIPIIFFSLVWTNNFNSNKKHNTIDLVFAQKKCNEYGELIVSLIKKHDAPFTVYDICSVIFYESTFRGYVGGDDNNSIGYMQIKKIVVDDYIYFNELRGIEYDPIDLTTAKGNLNIGIWYLTHLYRNLTIKYLHLVENPTLIKRKLIVFSAYNTGMNTVRRKNFRVNTYSKNIFYKSIILCYNSNINYNCSRGILPRSQIKPCQNQKVSQS